MATETARRPEPTPTASQKSAPGGRAAAARDAATGPAGRETPGERYTQQMDEPVVAERAGGASQGPTAGVPAMEAPPGGDAAPAAPARNAAVATPAGRPRVQSAPAPASATRVASGGPPVQPSLLGRARAAVTRVMGRGDLVVRVIVEPASASSEQVRRVRVEVVLSGALRDQGAEVRRELFRALPLDAGRGDEVVIIAD